MSETETKLIGEFDAKVWAEEFVARVKERPEIATDEGTMIGWFANAIMAGYDHRDRKREAETRPDTPAPVDLDALERAEEWLAEPDTRDHVRIVRDLARELELRRTNESSLHHAGVELHEENEALRSRLQGLRGAILYVSDSVDAGQMSHANGIAELRATVGIVDKEDLRARRATKR